MGAIYTDQDVVVDGDLVTGRTGGHCHLFARAIIDLIAANEAAATAAGSRACGPDAIRFALGVRLARRSIDRRRSKGMKQVMDSWR